MMNSISVAIVEDDDDLRETIIRFLGNVGIEAIGFTNAGDLNDEFGTISADVIILDVNLPGENGFVAAARLRARSMVGIIMLTGRTDQQDRLLGLSMGVDHYLAKPVDLRELESLIRNLARRLPTTQRRESAPSELKEPEGPVWTLDREQWSLVTPNGTAVELSAAEFQVLAPIFESPGRALSRDEINAKLGKPRLNAENRSLDVLISRTRRKIETVAGQPLPLRAARGTGYVFTGLARIEAWRDG
jgi:DNA-binding response OmpR family regulator